MPKAKASDGVEWSALVDTAKNEWRVMPEEEAKKYPVVQCRLLHAISASALDDALYGDKGKS